MAKQKAANEQAGRWLHPCDFVSTTILIATFPLCLFTLCSIACMAANPHGDVQVSFVLLSVPAWCQGFFQHAMPQPCQQNNKTCFQRDSFDTQASYCTNLLLYWDELSA
jgi:hypothetical protein